MALALISCTERIDIPLKTGDEKLVVEGYLFDTDSVSWVRLSKTAGYFSDQPTPSVSDASVVVEHNTEQWSLQESKTNPGTYYLRDSSFRLIPNDTFQLKIRLKEPVGGYTDYESQTFVPAPRLHLDSLSIEYSTDFDKWMIRCYGQDLPGKDYYLFNSQVNGKIVTDSIQLKVVREDVFFDGRYLSGPVIQVLNQDMLKPGDFYTLLVSNITGEYYDYITGLQDEVNEKNPLFSGPPANVPGNINHGALGFFTAFFTERYAVKLEYIDLQ
ncbi:DUF4249 domain-containing protein [Candidatus Sulfidibacterium hydrothermale]|uniref:DUF4249 domain-containing protein n=1 Tax=Candidatus Sulfidibacterium hydrothermale TaxID=2875962 RepID=UPI001F0B4C56|nr:DUF4249 domain-containing protein [Candidatus Sulfidibacterium hydrothermale]UBM63559.1 DUF4249 domain-containing protein [Candidatus Sulfidibacterium hydrothermale]